MFDNKVQHKERDLNICHVHLLITENASHSTDNDCESLFSKFDCSTFNSIHPFDSRDFASFDLKW